MKRKVLIVDDDFDVLTSARILLKRNGFEVSTESNPENIPYILKNEKQDIILLDMNFKRDVNSGKEGIEWLEKIIEIDKNSIVIMVTGFGDIDLAVRSIKIGATDFVLKPWHNEKLLATLNSAVKLKSSQERSLDLEQKNSALIEQNSNSFEMIGESKAMKKVFDQIRKVADTDANILILGENGTGKELIARYLHTASSRKNLPFVTVDLGLIQENLFESELFGHVKGAFTDAKADKTGKMELADGGTLFFDEIGNLPLNLQPKLLRSLEERTLQKLGDNQIKNIDIRLVSATNSDIQKMIQKNEFRNDLLFRINTVEIKLPPLRERENDSILLADFYLELYSKKYKKENLSISLKAYNELQNYDWPGNIRELRHTIEKAVILSEGNVISSFNLVSKSRSNLNDTLDLTVIEKNTIIRAIEKHSGNISQAAKELGITRAALYRRMEKHRI